MNLKRILSVTMSIIMVILSMGTVALADATELVLPECTSRILGDDKLTVNVAEFSNPKEVIGTVKLDYGMEFNAKVNKLEENDPFKYYNVDYVVTFNMDVSPEKVMLVGQYDAYNENWIILPLEETVKAGTPIRVMRDGMGGAITYKQVAELVNCFKCGVITQDMDGLKINVELKLYETNGVKDEEGYYIETGKEYTVENVYSFTIGSSVNFVANTDSFYYIQDETPYSFVRFLFFANTENVDASGIKFSKANDITQTVAGVSLTGNQPVFYGDITGIPEGNTDTFYAMAYVTIGENTYWSTPISCKASFVNYVADYIAE